jgi:hypothetical protein
MKREVMLVGGPGDGKIVMVDHDRYYYKHVSVPVATWSANETALSMTARTDTVMVYAPRRRGDYSWYQTGEVE